MLILQIAGGVRVLSAGGANFVFGGSSGLACLLLTGLFFRESKFLLKHWRGGSFWTSRINSKFLFCPGIDINAFFGHAPCFLKAKRKVTAGKNTKDTKHKNVRPCTSTHLCPSWTNKFNDISPRFPGLLVCN